MQIKQMELIQLLMTSDKPIFGKDLAERIGVSRRTVINYIREMNSYQKEELIVSTPKGYAINKKEGARLLSDNQPMVPQNYQERSFYIIKKFLINHVDSLDIFDLCEELCVSISLMKNDIKKMNQSFSFLKVRFITKNNHLKILGDEKSKRQLMNFVLQRNHGHELVDMDILRQHYGGRHVDKVLDIIDRAYEKHHYYLNDFFKVNLLLHGLIMVNRINSGNSIREQLGNPVQNEARDEEQALSEYIRKEFENAFSITINEAEFFQLYLLIRSNSTYREQDVMKSLESCADLHLLELVKTIVKDVEASYYLELNSESFLIMFTLHIKNLLSRIKTGARIASPLKKEIRHSLPFLYDIALSITHRVTTAFDITEGISEDEISFIVLHLGAEIEKKKNDGKIINALLYIPKYIHLEREIVRKILYYFGNQISILKVLSFEDVIADFDYDILIACADTTNKDRGKTITITPFVTDKDIGLINDAISEMQDFKQYQYLVSNFDDYFAPENFIIDDGTITSRDTCISQLCSLLTQNGLVQKDFMNKVMSREEAVSTGYDGFAIPHSISFDADYNGIAVMISNQGIIWAGNKVHIIFLMSISPDTLNDFQHLYASISYLLTETKIIQYLKKVTSFKQFKETMLNQEYL